MEEQRMENYLSMPELDLKMSEDETIKTYISLPIFQIHKLDPLLFCIVISALHSCIGDKALERIVCHSARRPNTIIDSKHDFIFGDTLVRSTGKVELILPKHGYTFDISVILDVVDVEISTLLGLKVQDGNNLLVDYVTNDL